MNQPADQEKKPMDKIDSPFNLDWNQLWKKSYHNSDKRKSQKEYWNSRAPRFAGNAGHFTYVEDFISHLAPEKEWTILDVGSGSGTLALPLAERVRSITAIDLSDVMLSLLDQKCHQQGLTNIVTQEVSWEDDWNAKGIKPHDVVIASRSLVPFDLRTAIEKLDSMARKKVVITTAVGTGPFDPRLFAAINRKMETRPDYIYVLNLLYQMGINAEVRFISHTKGGKCYTDLADAVASVRGMLQDLSEEENHRLEDFFKKQLIPVEGGWQMKHPHIVRWAYISWDKQ